MPWLQTQIPSPLLYELGPQEDEEDPWLEEDWLVVEEAELELVLPVVEFELDELFELDDEFDTVLDEFDEEDADPLDELVEDEDDPDEEDEDEPVDEPVEVVVVLQGFCPG